ncbi:hypothetical protein AB1Y20_008672 [Prymnesium parvum]|uniref:Uncharacterized protein n=1 Tax=Prymnesium parvum TaxID=97485 RepID=A0AB34IT23_PRYPA
MRKWRLSARRSSEAVGEGVKRGVSSARRASSPAASMKRSAGAARTRRRGGEGEGGSDQSERSVMRSWSANVSTSASGCTATRRKLPSGIWWSTSDV